ncbi:hypothetical protein D7B24_002378 [Verticillium nonalfalfae]|uniref:FAD-binding PCMH-type domain-containing protein n=1 Tax=Verticillium nonalfalfae TaxID=1051616 RepID=A0A3M9Y1R8_9PEZI|nr:uncharacterized protein D7B24_002378 [Verticillium nonalfalfae]RNJ53080.1 hypothetical protein D7B24_002378 [Verticillium nonalfalfae]
MLSSGVLTAVLAACAAATGSGIRARGIVANDGVRCACNQLETADPEALLRPNSTQYNAQCINVWDKRSNLAPACVYLPTTAESAANAIGIFNTCGAQFAVRGGGHMNAPGSNSINDGVLLALNNLKDIKVNDEDLTIEVAPGNKWVDVYEALAPFKRYAIGGRLKTIGVPGLTLIGGVSYFLNKYGYTMDNVVSYDVILGNGTSIQASQDINPELFWSLKGGAGNFGLVTKFVMKTYDVPLVTSTMQIFNESAVPAFIKATCDMVLSEDDSVGAGAVINLNYNASTKSVTPQIFGLQETPELPPSRFANFTAIPAVKRIHNVTEPVHWHSKLESPNQMFRIQFGHHTIKPDADQLFWIYQQWRNAVEDIADVEGILPTLVLNSAPKSAAAVGKNNGVGNAFGLNTEESYIWWQIATSWDRPEDDLRLEAWAKNLLGRLHKANKDKGLATEFLYIGDAAEWQDPIQTYGEENLKRLRAARDQYDPQLVFTKLAWGGFKLGY